MSVGPYPEYKDSGVEWIGAIPKPWSAKRLSFLFRVIGSGTTPPTDGGSYYDGELPWVTTGELREAGISDTAKKLTYDALTAFSTLRMYPPGTLLIAMYGATIGRLGWLSVSACTNQACCALAAPQGVIPRFAFFALLAANEALILLASGGGQPNINQEKIRAFRLPMPSLIEQEAIAAFLDQETGKIDALVAEQERLIALLKEKRQAVVSQAVTKGLNPNAPMKDSGIEWLGQVPAHWEVVRVKQVARLESGHTPSKQFSEYWEGGDIDWVSLNDSKHLAANDYISETKMKITALGMANSSARLLPEGAVVFTRDATVGLAAITTHPMAVSQHLIAWCPSRAIMALYLLRVFNIMKPFLDAFTFGATIKTIGMADVGKLITPLPPIDEQAQILTFLEHELPIFDTLITEATQAITLLRERRAALISAAVTGKIDVRALATSQPEAA